LAYVTTQLAVDRSVPLTAVLIASAVGIVMCPLFGALSDRVGRRAAYLGGAGFMVVFAFPFFLMRGTRDSLLISLAILLAYNLGPTAMFAVQATFFSELFGPTVRYTGLSIAYQVSAIIGGVTPLIAASLLKAGGGTPWLVAGALAGIALLSLICAALVWREPVLAAPIPATAAGLAM